MKGSFYKASQSLVCQVCKAPITDEGNSDVKPDTEHGVLLVIALVQWPFSRITRLRCYQNVSTLLTRFFEAKDDGGGSNNWRYKMCKAPVKSSPSTNQHLTFYSVGALPTAESTVSMHWRRKLSHSTDLLIPSSPWSLPTLSLTTKGSWFGEGCQTSRQPSDAISNKR